MPAPATVPMDPSQLARRAVAITGKTEKSWRAPLARLLGVNHRTVERWEQAGRVPVWLPHALAGLYSRKVTPTWIQNIIDQELRQS